MKKQGFVPTLIAGLFLAIPAGAQAEDLTAIPEATPEVAASCPEALIENPFLFEGDSLDYVLAPNGSFEAPDDGWLLEGGAAQVPGNDPFPIRSDDGDGILSLPAGASATSASMCIDLNYPTFRFALQHLAPQDGRLKVEVIYPESEKPKWRKVAAINSSDDAWSISDHLELSPERGGADPGARQVALRFTVKGADAGAFQMDDVYVDPRARI